MEYLISISNSIAFIICLLKFSTLFLSCAFLFPFTPLTTANVPFLVSLQSRTVLARNEPISKSVGADLLQIYNLSQSIRFSSTLTLNPAAILSPETLFNESFDGPSLFSGYHNNENLSQLLFWVRNHPNCSSITRLYSIGRSTEGRELYVLEFAVRPGVHISSTIVLINILEVRNLCIFHYLCRGIKIICFDFNDSNSNQSNNQKLLKIR